MNRLNREQRIRTVAALVEGNSLRSTARMVGVARNTVTSLLVDLGFACARYQDDVMRALPCKRLQADEIWSFCYSKAKNVPADKADYYHSCLGRSRKPAFGHTSYLSRSGVVTHFQRAWSPSFDG